jgi:hypothetical protein
MNLLFLAGLFFFDIAIAAKQSPIAGDVLGIEASIEPEFQKGSLVKFLCDGEIWKGLFTQVKSDPEGFMDVAHELGKILCTSEENNQPSCMVKLADKKSAYADIQHVQLQIFIQDEERFSRQRYGGKTIFQENQLTNFVRDVKTIINSYSLINPKLAGVTLIPEKELVESLLCACKKFNRELWPDKKIYDDLIQAAGIKADDVGKNPDLNNKRGRDQLMSLEKQILLYGVLPVSLLIIGLIIYFVIRRKKTLK